ncbi:hypothetical protein [Agrobacterium sp. LMR679]|uniref:hypothetical protein n=1 Tax=Agrobacterium sp. LMR679 TaxID=3014335 RepID=UPI0022AF7431|nr:hypothetical protein [Agrobacterium sp. LMR679]MCZ4074967.1 hypothetical protein [Agrobacterium sp. LMR679]
MDVVEILDSEELNAAVKAVEILLEKHQLPRKSPTQKTFKEIVLGREFRARDALNVILSSEPAYPGFREVLSSGFVGWALFPDAQPVRHALMTHAVLDHMDDHDLSVGLIDHPLDLHRDMVSRYVLTGVDFLSDIYDPLGGYQAFARIFSLDSLSMHANSEDKSIKTVVRALLYLHHGADRYQQPEFDFAPSLNRATKILADIKKSLGAEAYRTQFVARSLLHDRWSSSKQTLALLYAASTIRVKRKSLLTVMLEGAFSYKSHKQYLDEWVGRGRFVAEHIFQKMENNDLYQTTIRLLDGVEARPFKAAALSPLEETRLTSQFRKRFRQKVN